MVLPLLESDLLEILWAVTEDALADVSIQWKPQKAICVVLASPGYPEQPRTGSEIQTSDATAGLIFHAGTRRVHGTLQTAGDGLSCAAVLLIPSQPHATLHMQMRRRYTLKGNTSEEISRVH